MPKQIDGRDVVDERFTTVREDWNEYETASGVTVRVKTVVHKIARVLDENGKPSVNRDGDPHVSVRSQIQIVTAGGQAEDEVH